MSTPLIAELPPFVVVEGDARARGLGYGRAVGAAVRRLLAEDLAHINRVRRQPMAPSEARAIARDFAPAIASGVPDVWAALEGFALGAGLELEDALILQLRRELIGWGTECSLIAFRDEERACVVQTVDLPGDLAGWGHVVLERGDPQGAPDMLYWTVAGLLGFLGLNAQGLAIGINMVVSGGWRVGVPPYLIIRHLLGRADVTSALAELERVPRASSRAYTLVDTRRLVTAETTPDRVVTLEDAVLTHANHYQHPELTPVDRLPPTSTSHLRSARLEQLVAATGGRLTADTVAGWLADHDGAPASICAHDKGAAFGRTIAGVVLEPALGRLRVAFGNPCAQPYQSFLLKEAPSTVPDSPHSSGRAPPCVA